MTIFLWMVSLVGYIAFLLYVTNVPPDLNLFAGLAAILVGLVGFSMNNRVFLLISYGLLLLGELFLYPVVYARGILYIWLVVVALTLFFGSLSMRQD